MPVEGLPIVVARGLIGYPGLEIGMGGVRVIVLVMLAVVPVVLLVRLAVRGLPPVVDMDVVVRLDFLIVLLAPLSLTGLRLAVIFGAIRFAVLEVRSGVVVLGVLIALIRSSLPGQDRRSHEHHCRQQPQKQHQPSQLFLLPKTSPYSISRRLEPKPPFRIRAGFVSPKARNRPAVELGCRPVFVGVVAQGQYRAVDAGEQVRRRLIAIAFATGYVPCGDDDRVAGAVSGVVLCTGLSGGLGGMPGASLGGGLFGGLIRSGILRTAADGQEDGQCEAPNHDRCDPPSAHGYHRFSFAFVRCSLSTVGEIEVSLKREGEGPERQEARGRADQHQSVTTKLMCGTHLPTHTSARFVDANSYVYVFHVGAYVCQQRVDECCEAQHFEHLFHRGQQTLEDRRNGTCTMPGESEFHPNEITYALRGGRYLCKEHL